MDVSVIVSKSTLKQLDQFLIYHQNQFVKKLEIENQISLDSYLIPEIKQKKKKSRDKSCCLARIWNKGYGGQCKRFKKEGHDLLAEAIFLEIIIIFNFKKNSDF